MRSRIWRWRAHAAAPNLVPMPAVLAESRVGVLTAGPANPPQDASVSAMLAILKAYLPPAAPPLPAPSISIASLTERAVGIGNRRGTDVQGTFEVLALKGRRLDAVVRFQLWADQSSAADAAINDLQSRLLAARGALRADGFLRTSAVGVAPTEHLSSPSGWRATADIKVLFEYRFEDTEEADSLIAQIPIDLTDLPAESTIVTDEMVRWDRFAALALEVRGAPGRARPVGALAALAYLPAGWMGGAVTVAVTIAGGMRSHTYANVRAFLGALTLDAGTVDLGGNPYESGRLIFPNPNFPAPIVLTGGDDVLRISYAAPALDRDAVMYLRVLP